MAFIESTGRRLGVCQFVDNDQFSNVEVVINKLLTHYQSHCDYSIDIMMTFIQFIDIKLFC